MQAPLVVGVGRVGVAISGLTPNLPQDSAAPADLAAIATSPAPGIAVALHASSRLGCRTRMVGTHGDDLLGQLARSALREARIDIERLRPIGTSACEIVTVAGDGTLRTRYAGLVDEPAVAFDVAGAIDGASALLIDGTTPFTQLPCAEAARGANVPVILDIGELREGTSELIAACDILIVSERAGSELAPQGELADALSELVALGPRAVVITLGENGAIGRHGDRIVRCPAFAVDALDTYGAGSVFHGAFAAALLSELPFARCIELASAAAALALRDLGPWAGVPSRDDVLALVRTRR